MNALTLFIIVLWVLYVAKQTFRVIRQYMHYRRIPEIKSAEKELPSVSVIIPARNEEKNIELCVKSFLSQVYPPGKLEIIVVDDSSTDKTFDIALSIAEKDPGVKVKRLTELPEGWTGKNYACWSGYNIASGEILIFVDADVRPVSKYALISAVNFALKNHFQLLSIEPRHMLISFWERLIMPSFLLSISTMTKIDRLSTEERSDSLANGQFLLFYRSAYEKIGGHKSVAESVLEDMAFARKVKEHGFSLCFAGAEELFAVRMYRDLKSLWTGMEKIAAFIEENPVRGCLIFSANFISVFVALLLPFTFTYHSYHLFPVLYPWMRFLIWTCSAIVISSHFVVILGYFKLPLIYAFLFPLGAFLSAVISISGIWKRVTSNLQWKGRRISGEVSRFRS